MAYFSVIKRNELLSHKETCTLEWSRRRAEWRVQDRDGNRAEISKTHSF